MFLPGGHIEFGESAKEALIREIEEETGITVQVSSFIAAVEHQWQGKTHQHCEISLIFFMTSTNLSSQKTPESREPNIEFLWHPLHDLTSINLQPSLLKAKLLQWVGADIQSNWGSTFR